MSKKHSDGQEVQNESNAPDTVAIEGRLPLTAIDIESQKDMTPPRGHTIRNVHKWFAARPTPASRLAILGSVLPETIDDDELLRLMQIGPKALDGGRDKYVERKFSESKSGGTIDDHYGYPNPNTQSPTQAELESLHDSLRESWDGELPTVLDPTSGRGTIPFEAIRYGLPTKANELNPVPSVIMKVALEYAPEVGSLESDIYKWRDKIHETAKEHIDKYYPTEEPGREILNSAMTYLIQCDACNGNIPLVVKWWLNKTSDGGDAIQPIYEDGKVTYEHVKVQDTSDSYDPSDGPVTRGDAECPHCSVVTENDDIRQKICNGEFEYSIYGVNYATPQGDWVFRGGSEVDERGMQKAAERVDSDFEMMDFLSEPYPGGHTDRVKNYGVEQWRDLFTPRQLVVHYEYLQAYRLYMPKIKDTYADQKANAILTLLSLASSRALSFNSRLSQWFDARGYCDKIFTDNNFALRKMAGDNNLSAPRGSYCRRSDQVIESYESLVSYLSNSESSEITCADAADLTKYWDSESIDVAVVDPPYYSSIMYAELSDVFYVLQKQYLGDVHSELFTSKLTNKDDEAVANPSRFDELADGDQSRKELSDKHYEQKMQDIFAEIHELLNPKGIITVMFTHRDMDAWDTLTTAFINAGFTVTATHPIKTEMSDRIGMQGKASADSSIFLVGRKRTTGLSDDSTLWNEIKRDIRVAAETEASDVLNSGYNVSKVDTIISAYGPTLKKYAEEYPVVNKKGEDIRPREALSEARTAVISILSERFLETEGLENLDNLSRWYILSWFIYENDTFPYDEGRQLGVGAGIDVDKIKRSTKIWRMSTGDIQLKSHDDRVQDIVRLKDDSADNPSSRKYPVNPTDQRFTYTIDAVHAALHIYEKEGAKSAWNWLTEKRLKNDKSFELCITALLEVLPQENEMFDTLTDLISGKTGNYLDIKTTHLRSKLNMEYQAELGEQSE